MIGEIDIKVGKTYSIDYIISELKKHPDIKIGHIYTLNKHEYHLGIEELENLKGVIHRAEKEKISVYDVSGKRKISPYEITVLGIIDPYTKYIKYDNAYKDIYRQIIDTIETGGSEIVRVATEDILRETRKDGFEIEKDDDLFDGMYIYFKRKGIDTRRIIKEKDGHRKEYIIFGKEGHFPIDKDVEKKGDKEKEKENKRDLFNIDEHDALIIKEKTKEFEYFYDDLMKTIIEFIKKNNKGDAAVLIDNIMDEAKKTIPNVYNDKDTFLKGLILYFREIGINIETTKSKDHLIFNIK